MYGLKIAGTDQVLKLSGALERELKLYTRDSLMCTLANSNSEDPDEMPHFVIWVCTGPQDANSLQGLKYILIWKSNL